MVKPMTTEIRGTAVLLAGELWVASIPLGFVLGYPAGKSFKMGTAAALGGVACWSLYHFLSRRNDGLALVGMPIALHSRMASDEFLDAVATSLTTWLIMGSLIGLLARGCQGVAKIRESRTGSLLPGVDLEFREQRMREVLSCLLNNELNVYLNSIVDFDLLAFHGFPWRDALILSRRRIMSTVTEKTINWTQQPSGEWIGQGALSFRIICDGDVWRMNYRDHAWASDLGWLHRDVAGGVNEFMVIADVLDKHYRILGPDAFWQRRTSHRS